MHTEQTRLNPAIIREMALENRFGALHKIIWTVARAPPRVMLFDDSRRDVLG
jgi:hypothetical protein